MVIEGGQGPARLETFAPGKAFRSVTGTHLTVVEQALAS